MKKILYVIILGIFLLSFISAWNFASSNDYSLINWTRYTTYQNVTNYTETDPVWTADKSSYVLFSILNNGSYLNEPYTDTFIANYSTFLTLMPYSAWNATNESYATWLALNNGTYANVPETDSYWSANYTAFNESWTNTFNATTNQTITNAINSIASIGEPNWNANFTAFNASWSSITNESYYLASNPSGFYNSSSGIGNWSADKSSYVLLSILNNGSYLNEPYTDTFIANYSTFLTHINWAEAMNGTLFQTSQWNATNESYYLASNPNQYYNITSNIGNWTADKSSYTLLSVLNNGSYLNPEGTDTFIGNYSTFLTHITYDDVMNGTLKDYFDGLYIGIGTETESKWNANYSTFLLNNISITNALNTKLGISQWNATNTSYALLTELNNGSYLNVDTNIGNWTADKTNYYTKTEVNAINTSMKNYVDWVNSTNGVGGEGSYDDSWINQTIYNTTQVNAINTSMKNYVDSTFTNENYVNSQNTSMRNYVNAQNTSQTNLINLNNQSVTNAINAVAAIGEPNWNANYSIFLTHATTSYVNTQNLSMRNYVNLQNTSQNSWISGAYNTTRNNYVTFVNASMRNYVNLQNTSQTNLINLNNQSVTNYINSVASIGEPNWNANFTAFNASWSSTYNSTYNMWAYNQTIPANSYTDSRVASANLHTHDASNITSPIWVNKTGDTMSGNLNMDSNNITAVDCITFASGGRICSG